MAQYRKRPVVIEAVQWTGQNVEDINDFIGEFTDADGLDADGADIHDAAFLIETLEGEYMTVQVGDWVIKGIKGEFYPCKPDIFAATHELVE